MIDCQHPNSEREQDCEFMAGFTFKAPALIDAQDMVDSTCLAVLEGHTGRVTHLRRRLTQCSFTVCMSVSVRM